MVEKAEREETQKAAREEVEEVGASSISNLPEMTLRDTQTKIPITQTNTPLPPARTVIIASGNTGLQRTSRSPCVMSATPELGSTLRQSRSETDLSRMGYPPKKAASMLGNQGPSREIVLSPRPDPISTSLNDIGTSFKTRYTTSHSPLYLANNIDMAIKACAPERSELLRNREEMQIVLALDEGYCHVTRNTGELEVVGTCSLLSCD